MLDETKLSIEEVIVRAESAPKPRGHLLVDGATVADTVQCCHCGRQWIFVKGSGRRRGWCMNCNAIHCGDAACDLCVPFERKLELYEAGKIGHLK